MIKLFISTAGYIFLRYLLFIIVLYIFKDEVKLLTGADLQNGEDWFYFIWLFCIPIILEIIIVGYPLAYALNRVINTKKKWYYLLFLVLFTVEFAFANYLYGVQAAILKAAVSLVLFFVFFLRMLGQAAR